MNQGFNFRPNRPNRPNNNFGGNGFWGPFLLGGITGSLVTPLFYNNRPNYYYPYPYQYPYYNGYYYYR